MIINVIKIIYWLWFCILSINVLGPWYGIAVVAAATVVWNLTITVVRERRISDKKLLHIIFSRATLPLTAYGCFCSPKYGVDGSTVDLDPIDELDAACAKHDAASLLAKSWLDSGRISKANYVKLKNYSDWTFIREAMRSNNGAGGLYLLGIIIGFLLRIAGRKVFVRWI